MGGQSVSGLEFFSFTSHPGLLESTVFIHANIARKKIAIL